MNVNEVFAFLNEFKTTCTNLFFQENYSYQNTVVFRAIVSEQLFSMYPQNIPLKKKSFICFKGEGMEMN